MATDSLVTFTGSLICSLSAIIAMETNTCILGTRNEIVEELGIHRHGIQLPIITGVNIGSLKVSFLELNDCAHIYDSK